MILPLVAIAFTFLASMVEWSIKRVSDTDVFITG